MTMKADDPWVIILSALANVFSIVGFSVTAITLVTFWARYERRKKGPRFKVGSPPTAREASDKHIAADAVGEWTSVLNFVHSERSLARRVEKQNLSVEEENKLERELRQEPCRYRRIYVDASGYGELPVIVENCGSRRAPSSYLGIIMRDSGVQVVGAVSEYMKISTLFVHDPAAFDSSQNGAQPVSKEIVDRYADYMYPLIEKKYGDIVYLEGALDGEMYEMVLLKIRVEPGLRDFSVAFRLGWHDTLISESQNTVALQAFEICSAATGQPREALAPAADQAHVPA